MLEIIRNIAAVILISVGVFFEIVSVIGIFRFKFVLNRMHSAAMGDTLAILAILLGLIILTGFSFTSLKIAVIILFFWIAGPVSSHLLANLVKTVDKTEVEEQAPSKKLEEIE